MTRVCFHWFLKIVHSVTLSAWQCGWRVFPAPVASGDMPPTPHPPPPSPKSLSAMALQFMCFLCVPWELLYFPEAPSPQSNKIWNNLCCLFFLGVYEIVCSLIPSLSLQVVLFILCVACLDPTQWTDYWDQLEGSTHHKNTNVEPVRL